MKKSFYIFSFIILGILVSIFLHAIIEIGYINLLLQNYDRFSLGLEWGTWLRIHKIYSIILLILGIIFGRQQGKYWWKYIYVDKKKRR